jgi:NAD(P)-dependent dehydrogenase (short-subunit alcohol dehydrogenase family)
MLTRRVVVVAGAAGDIGQALVDRFLTNGDRVIAADPRNLDTGEEARSVALAEQRLTTVTTAASTETDCRRLMELAVERAGRVDVLVNAAGRLAAVDGTTGPDGQPDEGHGPDDGLAVVSSMTRAALPLMRGHGRGRIVNVIARGHRALSLDDVPLVAVEEGIVGFSTALAREVSAEGITVNVVAARSRIRAPAPLRLAPASRLLTPGAQRAAQDDEDVRTVVGTIFFLSSLDADCITGQVFRLGR